ncbi:MFS transporter [Tessaracoccus sp. OH4464_COT-324]|uniref:MFS transporter n=1 Tax=Tessaracoccus sp. OH4464_COT-324 TaxID=2491059 RepID=UPI000F62FE24|nr:MFS transporter [Tessaracoccus sp. OH4464_COT-324]RRD47769.1 MFS transporter [Tessaracoccus sp. OH4464_COT-324]
MYRSLFWPVLLPSGLLAVGSGAVLPVLVLAALEAGASSALAAALISLAGLASLLSSLPVGAYIDRVGDRRAMTLAIPVGATLMLVSAYAIAAPSRYSLSLFVGSLLLRAPSVVAWNLARQSLVADAVPSNLRGRALTALGGTQRFGSVVGPLLSSALLWWLPIWSVFVFAASCSLIALVVINSSRGSGLDNIRDRTPNAQAEDIRWRAVYFAAFPVMLLSMARASQPVIVSLWGVMLDWSSAQISLAVAIGSAIELTLMVPGGHLKDILGRSETLAICLALFGCGFALPPLIPTGFGLMLGVAVLSVGNGLGAGINMTIGADLSPAVGRAKFLSIWAMTSQIGALLGPGAVAVVLSVTGLPAALLGVGAATWLGAAWSLATRPITQLPGRRTGQGQFEDAIGTPARPGPRNSR